jgi:hypothetical protein
MNDNMRKVLVALRSGEYTKTTGALQNRRGYCCLGVMCDVFEKATGEDVPRYKDVLRYEDDFLDGGNLTKYSQVKEWVGLTHACGVFKDEHKGVWSLAGLNDNGSTFLQIADFIESEPKGLLV